MRALHIGKILPPPYAGIEAHIEQLLPALQPEVRCDLLVSELGFRKREQPAKPYSVAAARTLLRMASTSISPEMPLMVARWSRANPGGIVHLHLPNPMGDLAVRTASDESPLVLTWHSDIVRQKRLLKLYAPMMRSLLRRADRIIAFTPGHLESSGQLAGLPASKLRIVPIGIDRAPLERTQAVSEAESRWRTRLDGRRFVFSLGRHVYYKGFSYLLDALPALPKDVMLVLGGSGPLTPELERQALANGVSERVLFVGNVSDIDKVALMHACELFCLPSIERSEAFGIAAAEAMLCAKPVVVCELGNGVNYLNRDGITGLTVPPRDVAALAQALCTLLSDGERRATLGAQARAWVESAFSIRAMREGTLEVYGEVS